MMNLTRPLVTLYAIHLDASTLEIGFITAAYALFPLVFAIMIGKAADLIGDRAPVQIGVAGMIAGMALPFLFPAIWSLYVSQALVGVAHIFISISLQNMIGNLSNASNRDHHFGLFSMAVALSGIVGPIAGGMLADFHSYSFAFMMAAIAGLIPMALSIYLPNIRRSSREQFDGEDGKSGSSLALLRIAPLRRALASSALVLYSRDVFIAYFPLMASAWGMSASMIGWIIGIQGIAMVLVRLFLSQLSSRFGREKVLWASILLAGTSFLFMPLTTNALLCGLLSAIMGAGLGCGQPLSMTTTYNASPKHRTGEVLGLRMASNRLSQTIAPLFFGLVGAWIGILSVFLVSGAFLIGGAFLTSEPPRHRGQTSVSDG